MDNTLLYYEQHADDFIRMSRGADISGLRHRFLQYVKKKPARILDFGCGAGRDTKAFLELGYETEAMDGSAELCQAASAYTGIPVRQMLFSEFQERDRYDGIWASASLLHLRFGELPEMFGRLAEALHENGILYASFKYGEGEKMRGDRFYTDMTEDSFRVLMEHIPFFTAEDTWISADVVPGREDERWWNMILRKKASK
ncbi:MAG: class I SAM-dependent methyltransferase [Lachnospiraceae bacterium]|nr:class I SAM-dependent methyltransferase [Lachnospiraceae bacterium]